MPDFQENWQLQVGASTGKMANTLGDGREWFGRMSLWKHLAIGAAYTGYQPKTRNSYIRYPFNSKVSYQETDIHAWFAGKKYCLALTAAYGWGFFEGVFDTGELWLWHRKSAGQLSYVRKMGGFRFGGAFRLSYLQFPKATIIQQLPFDEQVFIRAIQFPLIKKRFDRELALQIGYVWGPATLNFQITKAKIRSTPNEKVGNRHHSLQLLLDFSKIYKWLVPKKGQ